MLLTRLGLANTQPPTLGVDKLLNANMRWEEGITLGQSAVADESSVSKQLGEHKTFLKASRWGYSRAATGRGAGRSRCRFARARVRAEWLHQRHDDRSINSNMSASRGAH